MKVLYFAWVREKTGKSGDEFALPEDVTTVAQLVDWLKGHDDACGEAFADLNTVRVAVNRDHATFDQPVTDDDEVAFFPPVTGG